MTTRKYSSRSQQTSLTAAVTSTATSITVGSGSALLGGITVSAGELFTVVIDPDTALEEIVDVSAVSGNTLTVVRGVDGSTGQAHSAGAVVRHMIIGRDLREANTHIENVTSAHGLVTADVVTKDATQTITNKDLSSPSNTLSTSVVTLTGSQTLTNKTLTTPTIGSFVNAQHSHADAASGGTINASVIANLQETIEDTVGTMVTANTESGINVTYDDATGKLNFNVNDPVLTLEGDVTGTATMTDLGNTTIVTTIPAGTIVNADINAAAGIAYSKLSLNGSITSSDIVNGTITATDIADGTITAAKMVSDPYARANHTGTQAASTISDFDTQVRTNRLDQMAVPTSAVSANSQKITNLGLATSGTDAVSINYINAQKGAADGLASLDGTGKIPFSQIPASAIADTFVVSSQSAMLALAAGIGDIAVRTDLSKSYILQSTPASTLGNWVELLTTGGTVTSVDGVSGTVDLTGTYLNKTTGILGGDLNANTYKVVNLGTPTNNTDAATKAYVDTVAGSATAAAASAAAAAASYDSFDDRYLGAKSSAPTLDNDGNALIEGALYWNSVTKAMYSWTGTEWGSISSTAEIFRYQYTVSAGATSVSGPDDGSVTMSYLPGKEQVYLNGVLLKRGTDYTATDGTSITGLAAMAANDLVSVITFTAFSVPNTIPNTLVDAKGDIITATADNTPARLAVGTNGKILKANSATASGLEWGDVDFSARDILVQNFLYNSIMGAI